MKARVIVISLLYIFNLAYFPQLSFSEANATSAKVIVSGVSANLPKADKIEPARGISVDQLKEREKTINAVVVMKQDKEDAPTYVEKPLPIKQPDGYRSIFPIPDDKNLLGNIDPGLVQPPDISIPIPDTGKTIGLPQIPIATISPPRQQITLLPRTMLDWKNYYNPQMKYEQFFIPNKALSRASIFWNNIVQQDNSHRFFGAAFTMFATTTTTIGEEKDEDSAYFSVL